MLDHQLAKSVDLLADPARVIESINPSMAHSLDHEYVIRNAKERLRGRSQQELEIGIQHANRLIESAERKAHQSAKAKLRQVGGPIFTNDAISFIELFEQLDLEDQEDFPNADPITYFALIAYVYALESLDSGRKADDSSPDAFEQALKDHFAQFARERITEAREMMAFIHGMEFEAVFRRKSSLKANTAKHLDYNQLKRRIFKFVDSECDELSNRKAAIATASRFEAEISSTMRSDDPTHQIAKWIGSHRKQKNKTS
ncbi:hypothetical protein [Marinobacter sp. F4216]|uniref:hypothetical protein n=1 Tax=Marinobacter sp. F4216 TaxID=2874281 RepID=UPI001CBA99F9|nr:hypothetical protein [Marinobacter sp. F4216]MBZ2168031.1 hypothetical protein [Marinobacter sp. F4216]